MEKHMIGYCTHCRGPVCPHEAWVATRQGSVAHAECDEQAQGNKSPEQTGKYLHVKLRLSA